MFDKARARRRKRTPSSHHEEYPLLDFSGVNKLIRSGSASLQHVGTKVSSVLHKTGDKIGDVYSAFAQVLGQQRENLEDYLAERHHQSRQSLKAPKQNR